MRVLIVPDKFKGTLSSQQAARAIASGWSRARPKDELALLPMSDGGEGFGEVMGALIGAKQKSVRTVDAAQRPCQARWWWRPESRTAIVESAEVIGLAQLPRGKFHPFQLDTVGLARLLEAVARMKPRRTYIGIGGSATNDGGFGLASALGWQFLNALGQSIDCWTELPTCRQIVPPRKRLILGQVTVAVDVQNPLLGRRGCTQVYGPQKGLRLRDFAKAEAVLRQLAKLRATDAPAGLAQTPGAGAAGGLGFGLMSFLNAKPEPGFDVFARAARLTQRLRNTDLVITGEGCLDRQSFMGKGVGTLAELCDQKNVPCMAMVGTVVPKGIPRSKLASVYSISSLYPTRKPSDAPARWLSKLAGKVARDLK